MPRPFPPTSPSRRPPFMPEMLAGAYGWVPGDRRGPHISYEASQPLTSQHEHLTLGNFPTHLLYNKLY